MSILTIDKMQEYKPCSLNNSERLEQIIAETEFSQFQDLAGRAIYDKLVAASSDMPEELVKIMENGVYQTIAYLAYSNYVLEIGVEDTFTGLVSKVRPDSTSVPVGTLKNLSVHSKEIAMKWWERCKGDLEAYFRQCQCCESDRLDSRFSEIIGVSRTPKKKSFQWLR